MNGINTVMMDLIIVTFQNYVRTQHLRIDVNGLLSITLRYLQKKKLMKQ